jgi:hypothetical protein
MFDLGVKKKWKLDCSELFAKRTSSFVWKLLAAEGNSAG